jgi:hypothetical protein
MLDCAEEFGDKQLSRPVILAEYTGNSVECSLKTTEMLSYEYHQ